MTPTPHIRFVSRSKEEIVGVCVTAGGEQPVFNTTHTRVLQQWWSNKSVDAWIKDSPDGCPGAWRDVPFVEEQS